MKSTFKLVWTNEAIAGLEDIIEYIGNKFSEKDIRTFIKKLDDQLNPNYAVGDKVELSALVGLTPI